MKWINFYEVLYFVVEVLCYNRRVGKVIVYWKLLVKYVEVVEVFEFISCKISVEVVEIIMYYCGKDYVGVRRL